MHGSSIPTRDLIEARHFAPSRWQSLAELPRALLAILSIPANFARLNSARRGDGAPVLVIPGFAVTDRSTLILRSYLTMLGYRVYGWGLGVNLGAKTIGVHNERLIEVLDTLYAKHERKVCLIGWSMGGIMARMISRVSPHKVEKIISLGAPFAGNPFANTAWRIYERLSGHSLSHPVAQAQIAESKLAPPVPSVSLYSKSDGVVSWRCCIEPDHPHTSNIEVESAHCAFGFSPRVMRIVADQLARRSPKPVAISSRVASRPPIRTAQAASRGGC